MTDKYLKAKHWQMFLLTFGIPMVFQFVMMVFMIVSIAREINSDPTQMLSYTKYFPIIMIIFMGVLYGWIWSVAIGLQCKIPECIKMKVTKFKIFFFIPLIYVILIILILGFLVNGLITIETPQSVGLVNSFVSILIPSQLLLMFCIFHSLYFVAKTFKTVELQRKVSFSDFAGEFFMIWFYPILIEIQKNQP